MQERVWGMGKNQNKWNPSFIFMFIAVLIALFTSIKVGIHSQFWMDEMIAGLFSHVPESIIPFFIQLTEMGDKKGIGVVALLALAWLLLKKRNYVGAAVLALSIALGNEISKLLKDLFERPRPDLEHLVDVKSYSFPSGHAMVGMIVYFMIAYLLIEGTKSKAAKNNHCCYYNHLTIINRCKPNYFTCSLSFRCPWRLCFRLSLGSDLDSNIYLF